MQITNTICDMCVDEGKHNVGHLVDLSWLSPGFEADLCDEHVSQLDAERQKLAEVWLRSARKAPPSVRGQVSRGKAPAPRASEPASDDWGVEGVDWKWSRSGKRRFKIINKACDQCGQVFETQQGLGQHKRSHDPNYIPYLTVWKQGQGQSAEARQAEEV